MSEHWEYQLRIDLGDDLAEAARRVGRPPGLALTPFGNGLPLPGMAVPLCCQ
jgi:hypothetical protein